MSVVFPGRWCVAASLVVALSACNGADGIGNLPHAAAGAIATARAARERVLYAFRAGSDGSSPQGTLIADASGALYGTTAFGGSTGCFLNSGCGTIFRLVRGGRNYSESVLYSFLGGSDGYGPGSCVIFGESGALYGTTEYGGDSAGDGTVFELTPSGSKYAETVIYRFKGGRDGSGPLAGLTMDFAGDLYGATRSVVGAATGRSSNCGPRDRATPKPCSTGFRAAATVQRPDLHRSSSDAICMAPPQPAAVIRPAVAVRSTQGAERCID